MFSKKKVKSFIAKLISSAKILADFATIISVIVIIFTLSEMQIQRNNAYMPQIIFEPVQVDISWGNTADLVNPLANANGIVNPTSVKIPSRNIGVGVAKQITYSIDISTFYDWFNLLKELDKENSYTLVQKDNQVVVTINDRNIMFPVKLEENKVFLLPNAEEVFDLVIPMQYISLLQAIYSVHGDEFPDIPDIKLSVSYTDVQGVKYNKQVSLIIMSLYMVEDSNGNGLASYQITMK